MTFINSFKSVKNSRFISRYQAFIGMFLIALGLCLTMALISSTNVIRIHDYDLRVHPDEENHVLAARFYFDNWLPPGVADPRTMDSYSDYGMSYLNEWDIVYLLAGKFATLIHPILSHEAFELRLFVFELRLFNVCLFMVMALIALIRRDEILAFVVLLTSPQIWYIFSYFNGDALPMFLSMLAAYEITSARSLFNAHSRHVVLRFLPLGLYMGLIILSKKTFWAFDLFALGCIAWIEFHHCARNRVAVWIKHMVLLAAIIFLIVAPRIAYDFYLNGTPAQKHEKIVETADILAKPWFKPSLKDSAISSRGVDMKDKGVSLIELFNKFHWGKNSLESSFGVYQAYSRDHAGPKVYMALFIVYGTFLIYLVFVFIRYSGFQDKLLLGWGLTLSLLIIGLSVYHSWVNDFQPLGRYLFGIFCIFSVLLARWRNWLNPVVINLLVGALFTLSAYSFVFYALNHIPKGYLFERITGLF